MEDQRMNSAEGPIQGTIEGDRLQADGRTEETIIPLHTARSNDIDRSMRHGEHKIVGNLCSEPNAQSISPAASKSMGDLQASNLEEQARKADRTVQATNHEQRQQPGSAATDQPMCRNKRV